MSVREWEIYKSTTRVNKSGPPGCASDRMCCRACSSSAEAAWPGEVKVAGRAVLAGPLTEGPEGDRFHADIAEVVHTHLNEQATLLVIEWWTPAHGLQKLERA